MIVTLFARYFIWHYLEAPVLLVSLLKNAVWYIGHVFSVRILWRSLFAPWRRVIATRTKRWDLEDMVSVALANLISRVIGMLMRLVLIIVGRLLQGVTVVFGIGFYVSWFVLPWLIVLTFTYGAVQLF